MPKPTLVKVPTGIYHVNDIQPGDILMFTMNPNSKSWIHAIENRSQSIMNEEGGRKDIEHVGVCVMLQLEGDDQPKKYMAHLMGRGFLIEPLSIPPEPVSENSDPSQRKKPKRGTCDNKTVHIYRIKNQEDREALAKEINQMVINNQKEFKKNVKWRHLVTIWSQIRRIFNSIGLKNKSILQAAPLEKPPTITGSSLCSKFVADVYTAACMKLSNAERNLRDDYMNVYTHQMPKTLQGYLGRNPAYEYYVLPFARAEVYKKLHDKIMDEAIRLYDIAIKSKRSGDVLKADRLIKILNDFRMNVSEEAYDNALKLLQAVLPILDYPRNGWDIREARSYRNIINFAKSQGLYRDFVQTGSADENKPGVDHPLKTHFDHTVEQYNQERPGLGELYKAYRRGRTDSESTCFVNLARSVESANLKREEKGLAFSLEHKFYAYTSALSTWFSMNPRRIVLFNLLLPVAGLLVTAIVGVGKLISIQNENERFLSRHGKRKNPASLPILDLEDDQRTASEPDPDDDNDDAVLLWKNNSLRR